MAKKKAKRDTYNYDLIGKNGKIIYRGKTKDPVRRAEEHRREGKRFKSLRLNPFPCSEKTARKREKTAIKTYKRRHGRRRPKYNKML